MRFNRISMTRKNRVWKYFPFDGVIINRMAYKENLQIVESDNCRVVLRSGEKLSGHMRRFERLTGQPDGKPPAFTWILWPKEKAHRRTWNTNGNFSIHSHVVSAHDITEFIIGTRPDLG